MNRWTSVALIAFVVLVAGGALALGFSGNQSAADGCKPNASAVKHTVTIQNGDVSDADVHGKICDTLTITNKDHEAREVAFGAHEHHTPYDGVAERVLSRGESLTVTLNKTGKYHWHDHLHDEVEGYFTVTN